MKIAVFSTKSYDKESLEKHNIKGALSFTYFEESLNKKTTNLALGFNAVCVFVNDKLDSETIKKLAKNGIKLIALRCAGFNNIDLETAAENKITVVRVPAYSPEAVAEQAVALIMTLNRKTHKAYNRIREGNFSLEKLIGFNLHNKTVGVIGTGRIGEAFSKIMQGFGCKVVAYDLYENKELLKIGVDYLPFDELIKTSDIISLHCPLTPETHHLMNKKTFSKMKKGVMLINTSRGALIDSADAITALKSHKIGYLGIDVYEQEEKLFYKDLSEDIIHDDLILRLISFPNVLITAHQGFLTKEALEQIAKITIENISNFEKNIKTENEVLIAQ
ncbi:2-hydroxyacid dehydrogenase [Polaribacter sp. Z014]|uniref:2-hydroxyacid dehydrogenase n=1 Tax=Polaribacter sp. Z014 TaxID=2927126 RepID=UPI002021CD2B|nr:2-hydroxyacid dehydrogenase [Polaribacter sp. Z014]MCL7764162.1 2-hydroxyacid dehydrogenase [Polaribacter sp. Z014]